ncbi:hypothetical protein WMF37_19600 [Sorangium sp. So ce291]|uniref:hypothetical protein n=1 Tax=Sorangium sp. So ce291 TaxID=3133294 RepID=UPI003F5FE8A6
MAILVPFFLFADRIEAAARALLASPPSGVAAALVLGGLLASDVVLPVPSSFVSAAVGASAARLTSVLLLFAGIVLLPGIALLVVRLPAWRRRAAQRRGASG